MKGLKNIRLIEKRDLHYLIDHGYIDKNSMSGVSIASKGKKSRGKHYYVRDALAFTAWDGQGLDPDDKDFQKWKKNKNKRRKR